MTSRLLPLVALLAVPIADAAPLEFVAQVQSVTPAAGGPVLTVNVTPAASVQVRVTSLTEIRDDTGLPISADELEAGQTLKIEALFTEAGILALEIEVLSTGKDFELRGLIEAVGTTQITLLGLVIQVPDSAEIKDEFGNPIPLSDLMAGDPVRVKGMTVSDDLVAREIRRSPQADFARISFIAVILEFTLDDQFLAALEGGIQVLVEITPDTAIKGELVVGSLVKVVGVINADLFVTALRIQVQKLIQLSPDMLGMGFDEAHPVEAILRRPLDRDLTLRLESADPEIAQPSVGELTIPEGSLSAAFDVRSFNLPGRTKINAFLPEDLGGGAVSVSVRVGGDAEEEDGLEIKWTPSVIRSASGPKEVSIFVKEGRAPKDLRIQLTLHEGPPGLVSFPAEVVIPQGEQRVRFMLELNPQAGKAVIRASLSEEDGGDTDDLLVELAHGQVKLKLEWIPDQIRAGTEQAIHATLRLDHPAPVPITISISGKNGDSAVVSGIPSEVVIAAGDQEASLAFMTTGKKGRVTLEARLPADFGGSKDGLRIVVDN